MVGSNLVTGLSRSRGSRGAGNICTISVHKYVVCKSELIQGTYVTYVIYLLLE